MKVKNSSSDPKHHHHHHLHLHLPSPSSSFTIVTCFLSTGRQAMDYNKKFATALRRNTNRMTLVLVYALLEWIIIALLIAHALLYFFILRFADYFGLHTPCPLCSSIEHLFRPGAERTIALCRDHLEGISRGREFEGRNDTSEDRLSVSVDFGKRISENDLASRIERPCDERCNGPGDVHPPDFSSEVERELVVKSDTNIAAIVDSSVLHQPNQISPGVDQRKDESFGVNPQHLEFYIGNDESELIPVGLKERYTVGEDDLQTFGGDVILELCTPAERQCEEVEDFQEMKSSVDALGLKMVEDNVEEERVLEKDVVTEEETRAPVSFDDLKQLSEATGRQFEHSAIADISEEGDGEEEMEEQENSQDEESDVEVSIGTEIPDHETIGAVSVLEVLSSFERNAEDDSTNYESDLLQTEPYSGCVQSETETLEFKTIVVEMCELGLSHLQGMCKDMELKHEMEEDKIPETPASTDCFGVLHSNLMLLDNRTLGTEGSIEGSLVSDIDSGEEDQTMEQLKEALKEERRSLQALYAELEEERNASAIAASQTMAMINRLQEEKAAMQMEAVQYQRMMEEQSEYDQEALQLLNDVVVKTSKEKEELAMELEACCQRLEEYETRENVTTPGGETEEEDEDEDEHETTPCDAVACLEATLDDFEDERLCILEHIKSLEEKLAVVSKDEDGPGPQFEDVRMVDTFPESGNGEMVENVLKHRQNGILGSSKAKRLLPLFDSTTEQPRSEEEDERVAVAVEEELDYVYERLDALEADGEFLRHCMGSLKKGDKGLAILREILQYLRDMRSFRD